jgi:hypothetical protein
MHIKKTFREHLDKKKHELSVRRLLPSDTYWTLIQKYQERTLDRTLGIDWLTKKERKVEDIHGGE